MFNPNEFEEIDWDSDDDEDGNLVHCLRHGVDERVVGDVLGGAPVEVTLASTAADYEIVGPDRFSDLWTVLFVTSPKRGDWLRPVTGWRATRQQADAWSRVTGLR